MGRGEALIRNVRCTGPAWLFGWAAAVFIPSAIIAYLGLSPPALAIGSGFENIMSTTWKVADDMAPAAKLMLGALLLALPLGSAGRINQQSTVALILNALLGVLAILAVVFLLPAAWSRGFGIGLVGSRLDAVLFSIYLAGGVLAGTIFTLSVRRCARRQGPSDC